MESQSAPYIELDDYKAPKGINSVFLYMRDKIKIRLIYWKNSKLTEKNMGTVLLQQGHNEFIEKYFETIQELLDRGFNVVCFDWRGQGLSDRMIKDTNKQYIEDFKIHCDDLNYIIDNFILKNFPKPFIGIGHSMGGCILLSYLKEFGKKLDKVILSAPMLGFRNEKILFPLINIISILLPKDNFLIGSNPNMGKETPFKQNDLTTDRDRYHRTQKLVRKNKKIRLWGVTNAWAIAVKKTLSEIRQVNWAESIENDILFINSLNDKVVFPDEIEKMHKRLKNSKIINFTSCEHEILMEKDKHRDRFWRSFDDFLNELPLN